LPQQQQYTPESICAGLKRLARSEEAEREKEEKEKIAKHEREQEERLRTAMKRSREETTAEMQSLLRSVLPLKKAAKFLKMCDDEDADGYCEQKQKKGASMKRKRMKTSVLKRKPKKKRQCSSSDDSSCNNDETSDEGSASSEEEGEIKEMLKPNKNKKSLFMYSEEPAEKGRATVRAEILGDLLGINTAKQFKVWAKIHLNEDSQRVKEWLREFLKKRGGEPQRANKRATLMSKVLETFEGG
jgi:hypothetical protein